jgi:hypothetical protein
MGVEGLLEIPEREQFVNPNRIETVEIDLEEFMRTSRKLNKVNMKSDHH